MLVTVKNGKGKIDGDTYWYPLAQNGIPDGIYQGDLIDQYCMENKLGGIYWLDGLSHTYNTREAIRIKEL